MKFFRRILAVLILLVALSFSEVQGNKAKAKVVALANGNSDVAGKATAVTDGQGDAVAETVVAAEDGGTAKGEVTAVSKDGGDAKAALAVKATEGATVDSKVLAVAEGEGATAVLERVVAANGNVDVATVSVKQAIGVGNGIIAALMLDKAFVNGKLVHEDVKQVIYASLVKAVDDSSLDRHAIADFIYQAVSSPKGSPAEFVKILAQLVKERGCLYIFPILREAELRAAGKGKDELFLSTIISELPVVRCVYPACQVHEPCCSANRIKSNFCELCPVSGMCQYKPYGKGFPHVLKTTPDEKGDVRKCACPV